MNWRTALAIFATLSTSIALADDFKTINGKEYKDATASSVENKTAIVKQQAEAAEQRRQYQFDSWRPSGVCTEDTWTPTSSTGAPASRWYRTAVWTGSENGRLGWL